MMEKIDLLEVAGKFDVGGAGSVDSRCRLFVVGLIGWLSVDDMATAKELAARVGLSHLIGPEEERAAARAAAIVAGVDALAVAAVAGRA